MVRYFVDGDSDLIRFSLNPGDAAVNVLETNPDGMGLSQTAILNGKSIELVVDNVSPLLVDGRVTRPVQRADLLRAIDQLKAWVRQTTSLT